MLNFPELCVFLALLGFKNLRHLYLPDWFWGGTWLRPADAAEKAKDVAKREGFQDLCDERSIRFIFELSYYQYWWKPNYGD